ncbi:MAG: hypothetical protein RL341_1050, partial [Pseudomonadota bacterium]|jgi:2-hydroxy-3-oxopropionate reductase
LDVAVWNRSIDKAQRLAPLGAHVHALAANAVRDADVVISILENGPVTQAVLTGGVAQAMKTGALWIDMASTQPAEARAHAALLERHQVAHVDAPVSGGTLGAEQGTLAIMCGAATLEDFQRAEPILKHLGRPTRVGGVGAGQLAKLANQLIVGVSIAAVSEAMLLVQKGGGDPAAFKAAIAGGFADSRIMQVHGQRMLERDFAKRGSMAVQLKDMRNIQSTAVEIGAELPVAELVRKLYDDAVNSGLSELDHSALWVALAQKNELQ